ncbi:AmpG family muropeptide MFS transporter [Curvibacter sp. CHRR-16]|uniref:AmpG family muropeptide MFS transporter n=1 Tax=Curvibacter sp. CHRR-16 TaxID=2835872 RepID=UPI001BD99D35|nr:MFS transporter [Curvibacter sp. CHRR-16]MBT0570076.1 AmpG family muropeptide MFS transporter [Curvibacter sp. CHRR-16]
MPQDSPPKHPWLRAWRVYAQPACLRMLLLGFSSGLPLLLVLGTLSFWLREAGVNRSSIGYFSWVGLAFAFKWTWSPLVDRLSLPLLTARLGRRRSWLLLAQTGIVLGLLVLALHNPLDNLAYTAWAALLVAIAAATQDIALDAFRIESANTDEQAALAATYQTGYRLAMIWAGAGALWVAARAQGNTVGYDFGAWQTAYWAMALSMLPGMVTVLFSAEPHPVALPPTRTAQEWINQAVVAPFADFFRRYGWHAAALLALIGLYRISDVVMGVMANTFYVDMGYTKDEVAAVTKIYGVIMTLAGSFLGGALAMRWGVMRVLMLGAVLSAASNLLFSWLAGHGHDLNALIAVISADNLAGGVATAAFIAYLSSLTNISYSATQYALFSSFMLLIPKTLAGYSGEYVDAFGYSAFFTSTALLGVPVILLLFWINHKNRP